METKKIQKRETTYAVREEKQAICGTNCPEQNSLEIHVGTNSPDNCHCIIERILANTLFFDMITTNIYQKTSLTLDNSCLNQVMNFD